LMKIFVMCSCLGFIMIQRNKVAIHGGTVVMGNKAVVITGNRGAGKSTLTTALRKKGYKFLADDVAATTLIDRPMVQCGFPYQKLCEDAMDALGYDKATCTSFEGDNKVKYIVPALEDFQEEDTPLTAICEIVPSLGVPTEYFKQCVQIAKSVAFYKVKRPREGFTVAEQIRCIEEIVL
ncbi:MAG: hypothetical protein RR817_10585, partial [Niameybacter sp.]